MDWNVKAPSSSQMQLADLDNPVGKAGSSEAVLIVAIMWGIAIVLA